MQRSKRWRDEIDSEAESECVSEIQSKSVWGRYLEGDT